MKTRLLFPVFALGSLVLLCSAPPPVAAAPSHARIVRLSLVQGEARFTRFAKSDPLADQNLAWESAVVNLPLRQGYVLATGNGRAEVEFENGATACLDENTVLEFYGLSLNDGALSTRLVLRQGTASFYVHPARDDLFNVTGGDFTAQALGRAAFRMDTYDDGSTVRVQKGRVTILAKSQGTELEKGQSFSMRAGDASSASIGRLQDADAFDKWVSARSERSTTASRSSLQYLSSPYYSSGFADLYTYGSFTPCAGFGNCWRPFGAGLGWSPFSAGQWVFDPFYGWSWVSNEPWGWLPYHFGGWVFSSAYGWLWVPGGFGTGVVYNWRPATAVWVRSRGGVGIVPVHPLDTHGRTPVNLAQGVIPANGAAGPRSDLAPRTDTGDTWKVLKSPPRGLLPAGLTAAAPPVRLSRTVFAEHDSSIAHDAGEQRFVHSPNPPIGSAAGSAARMGEAPPRARAPQRPRSYTPPPAPRASSAPHPDTGPRMGSPRSSSPAPQPRSAPDSARRSAPRASSPPATRPQ